VVVGVDGSDQARVAVLEAAAEAERLAAKLRIVCAVPQYSGSLAWVPAPMDREALFADIRVQLDAGVAWLKSHFPNLEVETSLVDGSPVDVLVEASRHVELVVVGTRRNAPGLHLGRHPAPHQGPGPGGPGQGRSAAG